ncbi:MAG: SUMF1/EgtB/PvdO family nonheme iron enzyme [Anaerolineae bacterium]|nr:SUMF1/EgtB/PvdO family nonheme iron enzyme [Anaerolineae bacterium]
MDPITIAIATALGMGLAQVGNNLIEKGIIEPALDPSTDRLKKWLQRGYKAAEADQTLQQAVQAALVGVGMPAEAGEARRYLLNLGFDQLQADDNSALRLEMARATVLLTEADPQLIPSDMLSALRWPDDRRQILADFLYAVRRQLANHPDLGALIAYADREAVRVELRTLGAAVDRLITATDQNTAYLRRMWADRGLDPAKPDALALRHYLDHAVERHSRISFLFIRPAGRADRLHMEADLETVFVPLQVDDPEAEAQTKQRQHHLRLPTEEEERLKSVTINDVVARYPVFLLKGLPGSGKTTLLRHLLLAFAQGDAAARLGWPHGPLLPILVPLRNFGRFLRDHQAEFTNPAPLALSKFIEDYFVEQEVELPPGFFRQRLREGRCLLLLDGLDEVADRALRVKVAQIVNAFIQTYARYEGNRFGLASRPRGYEEVAAYLPRPVVCTVQPLTPAGRDHLVTNLLKELEADVQLRRRQTERLLADIQAKDKVDELSRNPLFCTTLTLVYVYRRTTLPERRVDVYQELIDLMLGFWEAHKVTGQGVVASEELARLDGTGRVFRDDRHAVEAKRRALTDLADWLQREQAAETARGAAEDHLATFFREREGAPFDQAAGWATNFLDVAHQRSGLFVETDPDTFAFSHQNFREYLAATALIGRRDDAMVESVLAHAEDSWWEEVILLAAAHPNLSDARREYLLEKLLAAGHLILAGRCAVDAGDRLTAPWHDNIKSQLHAQMIDADRNPQVRYEAGAVLDELGWLPDDLNTWLLCPGCAEDGGDLLAMQYPVTNAQYAPFIEAGGYDNPAYWGGEESEGWEWRKRQDWTQPGLWNDVRFGQTRRGYPVVGVTWYEAAAYATWLTELLESARRDKIALNVKELDVVKGLMAAGGVTVRLPAEAEWQKLAGGAENKRYPWDAPAGPATTDEAAILARANTEEAQLQGTSPVGMYPLGVSRPYGLWDLSGNVWEWTSTLEDRICILKGGGWYASFSSAGCGARFRNSPNYLFNVHGFRLVSPVGSGS